MLACDQLQMDPKIGLEWPFGPAICTAHPVLILSDFWTCKNADPVLELLAFQAIHTGSALCNTCTSQFWGQLCKFGYLQTELVPINLIQEHFMYSECK